MIDNSTFANALVPILVNLGNGSINQSTAATLITDQLNLWNVQISTGALSGQVIDLTNQVRTLLTTFNALFVKGEVATVGDLPLNPPDGIIYIVTATGHGFARINGAWEDVGQFKGDPGSTVLSAIFANSFQPMAGELTGMVGADTAITLNVARSFAKCSVAPTADTTFRIMKNWTAGAGTQIGSVLFHATANTGTVSLTSTALAAGDTIRLLYQTPGDTTFSDFLIVISGDR